MQEQKEKTSVSTQAYSLFSKGKTTLEVTLALRLKADEAIEYRKEYCRLIQHDDLIHVYEQIKGNILHFVNLSRLSIDAGMDAPQVINLLKIANNDLPRVESVIERLRFVLTSRQKRIELEQLISRFEGGDEKYLGIKNTIKQEVESEVAIIDKLLDFALVSLIESLRRDPRKLHILYYNLSSRKASTSSPRLPTTNYSLQSSGPFMQERSYLHYKEETCEKILLDESMAIYDRIVEDLTNNTIVNMTTRIELSSSVSAYDVLEKYTEGSAAFKRS